MIKQKEKKKDPHSNDELSNDSRQTCTTRKYSSRSHILNEISAYIFQIRRTVCACFARKKTKISMKQRSDRSLALVIWIKGRIYIYI